MKVSYDQNGFLNVVLGRMSIDLDLYTMRTNEHAAIHLFSQNQKLQSIAKTEKLIDAYDVDDCPERLLQLLSRLNEVC